MMHIMDTQIRAYFSKTEHDQKKKQKTKLYFNSYTAPLHHANVRMRSQTTLNVTTNG